MMQTYTSTGTVTDAQTLHLIEPLPVSSGDVRVTVEFVEVAKPKWKVILERIVTDRIALLIPQKSADEIDAIVAEMKTARED